MMEQRKRLGRIGIRVDYVVDLDNEHMVRHAKDAMCENINYAVKHNEVESLVEVWEDKNAKESDIVSFLRDDEKDDEE